MAAPRRSLLVALAMTACLAAGCTNRVVADSPRYSPEDASSRMRLKDGVWLIAVSNCAVDTTQPVADWPECAQWHQVRDGQAVSRLQSAEGVVPFNSDEHKPLSAITVDGDPMLQELSDCPQSSTVAAEPKYGAARQPHEPDEKVRFCYNGLSLTGFDGDGFVLEFVTWPVFCGPPPPKGQSVTERPWDGLKIRGDNCLAENEAALRNAARRSFSLVDGTDLASRSRWVRASLD